jgi:hypothetical protein
VRAAATITAVGLLAFGSPAFAESTVTALDAFGLIGTWAEDCAKNGLRGTFAAPFLGVPTWTISGSDGDNSVLMQFEIKSATRITEDKIKLVVFPEKFIKNGQAVALPPKAREPAESIWVKIGNKMKATNTVSADAILLEKCLH